MHCGMTATHRDIVEEDVTLGMAANRGVGLSHRITGASLGSALDHEYGRAGTKRLVDACLIDRDYGVFRRRFLVGPVQVKPAGRAIV